ncbi:MAG: tyrosine--tRNA ligase, partial [Candidatus Omnitrophica bacterium]|nr:tyrosine--tRNA ligase [Candidatus Omnitrophota bacterium]
MDIEKQLEIIKRGAVEIISEAQLKKKLEESRKNKRPLIVKAGFDPTAPDIHLGHTVLLRKLRQFQDLGHQVIFLIGDFTARIGDPTGRSEKRKQLAKDEVVRNAATYKKQVSKILDLDKLKIVFNSEWFEKMPVLDILNLTTHATVSQMLARADFKKRLSKNEDISLLEFMYPLLQGYDSVILKADIELGGTDQIFNLLVGRDIQQDLGEAQQVVITMPLLVGTDGAQKMSKSFGNYIGINEPPSEIFGKIMSIPDELMWRYYQLLLLKTPAQIADLQDQVKNNKKHPMDLKKELAFGIVSRFWSAAEAQESQKQFELLFQQKDSNAAAEFVLDTAHNELKLLDLIKLLEPALSMTQIRRLITDGAISINDA